MSASNWGICPRCRSEEEARIADLRARATAGYGVLSVEEFDALRAEAETPIDLEALHTFREDYEIYGEETGTITVSYSGHCQKSGCQCGLDFTVIKPFWGPS